MHKFTFTRKRLLVAAAGGALALAAGGTAIAVVSSPVKTYTGCLVTSSGAITKVKEGDSPLGSPCASGSVPIRLSSGDITTVSVGTGLTGGGDNGDITIALDPKYGLRQDCASGKVLKWDGSTWACANDNDTTYTHGTGLELNGTEFSIASGYRVKNDQSCGSGTFANGIDSSGALKCSAASSGTSAYLGKQVNPTQGNVEDDSVGMPDDGDYRTYASVTVAPGKYTVTAKGEIGSEHNVCTGIGACFTSGDAPAICRIDGGRDSVAFYKDQLNDDGFQGSFSLLDLMNTPGDETTLSLECAAGGDGISIDHARIVATKVGSTT